MSKIIYTLIFSLLLASNAFTQDGGHSFTDAQHEVPHESAEDSHALDCSHVADHQDHAFDAGQTAFHHISDQNVYSIGPLHLPLPCILYQKDQGWEFFMSSKFHFETLGHGEGHQAYNSYVLDGGSIKRVIDPSFPTGSVELGGFMHRMEEVNGKSKEIAYVCYEGTAYKCEDKSKLDGGMFGGGLTSFYDFSFTKNVTTMLIIFLLMWWMFRSIAKAYRTRDGQAPKGIQSFIEPIFVFIQEEVVKPFLGDKWEKYQPFIMSLFFFILALNLFGQIPFFGGSNVTGNLAVTMVLAIIAFLVTNLSGNRDYWRHIFWMPGVPAWVKGILTPVEVMGLFIKPLTLMLRLFANITAGHMVVIIFVSLIFIFGNSGANPIVGWATVPGSALLTLFMMAIELLVAFIQAFVFAILVASYIGAATEEHHH